MVFKRYLLRGMRWENISFLGKHRLYSLSYTFKPGVDHDNHSLIKLLLILLVQGIEQTTRHKLRPLQGITAHV